MAGKFMRVRKIILPFISLVILASQLTGCAVLSSGEMLEELNQGSDVVLEYSEFDQPETLDEIREQYGVEIDDSQQEGSEQDDFEIGVIGQQEEEKTQEISQEELELIFEDVYKSSAGTHPSNWSIEFQITDEIGKINNMIPNNVTVPSDLRTIYTEWRAAQTGAGQQEEARPEQSFTFTDVYEAVYATSQVNIRSGPGTGYEKVGSLSWSEGVTRTGIGTGDYSKWSRVEFSDGTVAYVASSYLSTTKPVAQQPTTNNGGTTSQGSSGTQSDTGGAKTTPGGDGSSYADANGGSNGKTFDSDDLIITSTWDDIEGEITTG